VDGERVEEKVSVFAQGLLEGGGGLLSGVFCILND
jgi:hypothetical protein